MKATSRLNVLILSFLVLFGFSAADAFAADDTFDREFTVSEPFVLDVNTGSGSIKIRSGSGDEVKVHGRIKVNRRFWGGKPRDADELIQKVKDNPPIRVDDGRIQIGHFSDRELRKKVSISYEIVVPIGSEIIAQTGSGSITVSDIAAPVDVHTGSGSVKLEDITGSAKARTGSGSIHAERVGGSFDGKAGSGSIYLQQSTPGNVVVSTGSGSSNLSGVAGSVDASAGSGRITVDGRLEGSWKLDTGSGSVRVSLAEDTAFELDAEAGSGGIEIDHPLTVEGRISKRHIRGTVRGGGPLLQIETGSGKIRIN